MELTEKSILVPVDFTENSEFALQHAIQMAKYINRTIALLHIIRKDHEKPAAMEKLTVFSKQMKICNILIVYVRWTRLSQKSTTSPLTDVRGTPPSKGGES